MRMRRKKNLDSRFESVKKSWIEIDKTELNASVIKEESEHICFEEIFGNKNPVYLEIGCGKGGFAIEMAKRHPEINFVGVEFLTNVIVSACEDLSQENLLNVKFLCTGAEYLERYIVENSIERIYLNFSTPYQKKSYHKSRLTYLGFLKIYQNLLKKGGKIYQKTDDTDLFDYSLEQYAEANCNIEFVTRDLHAEWKEENVITEYEEKFLSLGMKINGAIVSFK